MSMPHVVEMITRTMTLRSWVLAASIFLDACVHQPTSTQAPQASPKVIPDLSHFNDETRQTMQLACTIERTEGPVAYGACLNRQIASLQQAQGVPVTSGRHMSETPTEIARSFFTALDQQRWMDAAANADPAWAQRFQLQDVAGIATSIQMSLKPDSGSAGSLVAIPANTAGLQDLIRPYASARLEGLRGVQTLGDLAALSPIEYLARSFEGTYHMPSADQRDGPPTWEILGGVPESDTLAYVIYRRGGATVWLHQPGEVEVMYFVRRSGSWYYRLSKDLTFPSLSSMIRGTEFNGRAIR